jgi:tRNA(adenine34) deaminase
MINYLNNNLMIKAVQMAQKAFDINEVPIGAVIYSETTQEIIGSGHNCVEKDQQVLMHAEIVALQQACKKKGSKYLNDCILYVTVEPCSMCLTALSNSRIKRIYYGVADKKFGAIEGGGNLFTLLPSLYKPECYGGFMEEESKHLMQSFFKNLRSGD